MKADLPLNFEPLPEVRTPVPMTALEFKRLSSMLAVIMGEPIHEFRPSKTSRWMEHAAPERRLAGQEPLPPFHPLARGALPQGEVHGHAFQAAHLQSFD